MATEIERFGTDLRLLGNLERQDDRHRGSDLFTTKRPLTQREGSKEVSKTDLATLQGKQNLEQALLLRFLTPLGELTKLGHPDYGSQLFELIGELNNDANRNRAKLFVLQALEAETRVKEVLSVDVTQNPNYRDRVDIVVQLMPIDSSTPLTVAFPFLLGGGGTP